MEENRRLYPLELEGSRTLGPLDTRSLQSSEPRPSPLGGRASSPGQCHRLSICTESEKTMSTHQLLLHSLDCNCSIRFSFSFLQLHLKETKRNEKKPVGGKIEKKSPGGKKFSKNLLEEAGADPQPCLLLHQLQQLLLGEGTLHSIWKWLQIYTVRFNLHSRKHKEY